MIFFPHAKINWGLRITGRLPNGYHTLETTIVHTHWEDILELTPASVTSLVTTGRHIDCPPEKNLVLKAFRLLDTHLGGTLPPTRIHLHKVIPDGAGLGGGSADAAWTLRGLNDLYSLGVADSTLASLASQLGADCPFFIYDRTMLCTGTGTTLTPAPLPTELHGQSLAIVKPPCSVSTAEAYAGIDLTAPHVADNDFEPHIIAAHPIIGQVKTRLTDIGATYASMSGSGSAVFGVFPSISPDALRTAFPRCDVHVSKL